MNRTIKMTLFTVILAVVLGLLSSAHTYAQDTDLSVSPSKGPADAPVEIAVFSCFL